MVIEDYCSLEVAKLLKEKGFNEPCRLYYDNYHGYVPIFIADGEFSKYGYECGDEVRNDQNYVSNFVATAPALSLAMKWLREVHHLDIIAPPQFDSSKWTYSAIIFKLSIPCTKIRLNDNKDKKEEAVEVALKYVLENLI